MQLGVCLPHYGKTMEPAGMRRFAERAEALGFDSLWVTDHIIVPKDLTILYRDRMLDPLATLNYLAGVTSRMKLGTSVIILPYRNPITVAKELATADVLSDGRVIFGVGAGWMEGEFRALNVDFAARGALSDEYLTVIKALWSNREPVLSTEHFDLRGLVFSPETVQRPHPPVWVGGSGRRSIRRAVELGDAWHPTFLPIDQLQEGVEYLGRLCGRLGRAHPPALTMRTTVAFEGRAGPGLNGTPREVAQALHRYGEAGIEHMALSCPEISFDDAMEWLERLGAEVRPAVR